MRIEHISGGATADLQRNDDHVAVFTSAGISDIVVIDGGSSVAERDYIDELHGDVAWFVHAFAKSLQTMLLPERDQPDCVRRAIADVQVEFRHLAAGRNIPVHA